MESIFLAVCVCFPDGSCPRTDVDARSDDDLDDRACWVGRSVLQQLESWDVLLDASGDQAALVLSDLVSVLFDLDHLACTGDVLLSDVESPLHGLDSCQCEAGSWGLVAVPAGKLELCGAFRGCC